MGFFIQVPWKEWDDSQRRIKELEARLEISPQHDVDGIEARDSTIALLERIQHDNEKKSERLRERIAELEAERKRSNEMFADMNAHYGGQIDEIERLRGALQEIGDLDYSRAATNAAAYHAVRIANQALAALEGVNNDA